MYHCSQKADISCSNDISFNFHDLRILDKICLVHFLCTGGSLLMGKVASVGS